MNDILSGHIARHTVLGNRSEFDAFDLEFAQRFDGTGELALAAVDQQQIRQTAFVAPANEATRQHLFHRREIVVALDLAQLVATVSIFVR